MPDQPTPVRDSASPPPPGGAGQGDLGAELDRALRQHEQDWRQFAADAQAARQPRGIADTLITAWADHLRAFLRRLIGPLPTVAAVFPCIVTAVNQAAHTCTVQLTRGTLTLGQSTYGSVAYGPTAPTVNQAYAVRLALTLPVGQPRGAPVLAEASVKVPGGRALYRKDRGSAMLLRYAWPPPASGAWEAETVRADLPRPPFLWGAATDAQGAPELVFQQQSVSVPPYLRDGAVYQALQTHASEFTHYTDLGAGARVQTYFPTPRYNVLGAIAYDGQNTAGWHPRYVGTSRRGFDFDGWVDDGLTGQHYQCCLEEPTLHILGCADIFNPAGHVQHHTDPNITTDVLVAQVLAAGTRGAEAPQTVVPYPETRIVDQADPDGFIDLITRTGSGCHWVYFAGIEPLDVVFDTITENTEHVTLQGAHWQTLETATGPVPVPLTVGAWHRAEQDWVAGVYDTIDNPPFGPIGGTLLSNVLVTSRGTWTLPRMAAAPGGLFVVQVALDPENQWLVWASDKTAQLYQWHQARPEWRAQTLSDGRRVSAILVQHPDGQDALGFLRGVDPFDVGPLVYTTDAGVHWAPAPALDAVDAAALVLV